MIRVTAKDSETELEMSGSGAEILATGLTFAVREGYDDARKEVYNDTENADVAP